MGLSPFHAQRVFTRWAGLSPKRFLGLLTVEHAKALLRSTESVMGAAYEVGLSGSLAAARPVRHLRGDHARRVQSGRRPTHPALGRAHTPFGAALLVASDRGLARLAFLDGRRLDQALAEAKADWPLSRFAEDSVATRSYAEAAFGEPPEAGPLRLFAKGTPFQVQVWRALMRIPEGSAVTYSDLAAELGRRQAARAVGSACRANRVGVLIPCHRVIRDTGALGGYQWGWIASRRCSRGRAPGVSGRADGAGELSHSQPRSLKIANGPTAEASIRAKPQA